MGIREVHLLLVCLLLTTIYCGTNTGYLITSSNWKTFLLNGTYVALPSASHRRTKPATSSLRGGPHNQKSKQGEKLLSRAFLLKKLALAVIYRDKLHRNKRKIMVPSHSRHNMVIPRVEKRTKQVVASIEVLVVVDNSIFQKYLLQSDHSVQKAKEKIVEYYKILFAMVDERYSSLPDKSFSLRVYICDIIIAENVAWLNNISRWSRPRGNKVLNASRALRRFQKWLRRKGKTFTDFDHAVLFTSYILSKKKKQIDGLAYIGTMCQKQNGKSSSVVQDVGDFQSAGVVAHEIGHSLGVSHDGEGLSAVCSAGKNYVMAPQASHDVNVSSNAYYFSQCSVKQIKKFVILYDRSAKAKCLLNPPKTLFTYDMALNPPGEVFDEDAQCQLAFGPSSSYCKQGLPRSEMCSRLWCSENSYTCRSSNRLMALPGTSCGYGKLCHKGKCVSDQRDENCPMGGGKTATCRKIIENAPYLCNRPRFRAHCCESCGGIAQYYFRIG